MARHFFSLQSLKTPTSLPLKLKWWRSAHILLRQFDAIWFLSTAWCKTWWYLKTQAAAITASPLYCWTCQKSQCSMLYLCRQEKLKQSWRARWRKQSTDSVLLSARIVCSVLTASLRPPWGPWEITSHMVTKRQAEIWAAEREARGRLCGENICSP